MIKFILLTIIFTYVEYFHLLLGGDGVGPGPGDGIGVGLTSGVQ